MSWDLLKDVLLLELPSGEKAVLVQLAFHANEKNGNAGWPSVDRLAKLTGLSGRSVQRAILKLEALGHISREERRGRSTLYTVHPRLCVTPDCVSPATNEAATPDCVSPEPCRTTTPPEPSGSAPKGAARPHSRPSRSAGRKGTRLAPEWQPAALPSPLAETVVGLGSEWLDRELSRFRDHWAAKAGPTAFSPDWQARWRLWLGDGIARAGKSLVIPKASVQAAPELVAIGDGLDDFRRNLAESVGPGEYRTWFNGTGLIERGGDGVVIAARSPFAADRIRTTFAAQLHAAAQRSGIDPTTIAVLDAQQHAARTR